MALGMLARTINHFVRPDYIYDTQAGDAPDIDYLSPQPGTAVRALPSHSDAHPWMPNQNWQHFAANVQSDPLARQWTTLTTLLTPFSVLIDFSSIDQNDHFVVRESILLDLSYPATTDNGTAYSDGVRRQWHQVAVHKLRIASRNLYIDDTLADPTSIVVVQPMSGPWVAKIDIAQVQGISKTVRYLVF